jgi:hypothetical protein
MIPPRALQSLLATKTPIHQPTLAVLLLPLWLDSAVYDCSCASNRHACLRLRDSTFSITTIIIHIIIHIIGVRFSLETWLEVRTGQATEHHLDPRDGIFSGVAGT